MDFAHFLKLLRVAVAIATVTAQIVAAAEVRPANAAIDFLVQKARSLEARDRQDLAVQVWQQVLVANANQEDALAALARWAKRNGRNDDAAAYLARLRRLSPDSPLLTQLDSYNSTPGTNSRLNEAAKLAAAQKFDEAMHIYREVFGSNPPPGGWAVAYYETLASTPGGMQPAIQALQKLMAANPAVPEYRVAAGKLMTYQPKTRQDGIKILSAVQGSTAVVAKAKAAWRQALVWEENNASYASVIREFLSRYPDAELENAERQLAKADVPKMGSKEEQVGYQSLNKGDLAESQSSFTAALSKNPNSWRAHAGLAYASMKKNDFETAVRELEIAHKAAPLDASVRSSLETAKFWLEMQSAAKSLDDESWQDAINHYRNAVALRPNESKALRGLGGALLAGGFPQDAIPVLTKAIRAQASDDMSRCALVQATLLAHGGRPALKLIQQTPAEAAGRLSNNLQWKAQEAAAYADAGQEREGARIYHQLSIPSSDTLTVDQQIQLAGLALKFSDPDRAATYAESAVEKNPDRPGFWQVLLSALMASGRQAEVARVFDRMPLRVKDALTSKPEFQPVMASIKEADGDLEGARLLLAEAIDRSAHSDGVKDITPLRIQLADVLSKLGRTEEAETMLAAITDTHADNIDAWRARLLLLHGLHRSKEIVSLLATMPQTVAMRLEMQGDMVNLLADAHAATGNSRFATNMLETYIARSESGLSGKNSDAAGANHIPQMVQLGWLLLDSPQDASKLFSLLQQLDNRNDLTPAQRTEITKLWVTWIVRNADDARKNGDGQRAVALLDQGAKMFPANAELQAALAGDLLAQQNTRRALNVYSNWGLKDAKPDDYAGAIGAALAEHNTAYADAWINHGLALWPNNPKLLSLAGDRAQSRHDLKTAKTLWKQALSETKTQAPVDSGSADQSSSASLRTLLLGPNAPDPVSPSSDSHSALGNGSGNSLHLASFQASEARSQTQTGGAFMPTAAANLPGTTVAAVMSADHGASDIDLLQDKIAALESRNTPYLDSRMSVWGRSGNAGFGKLLVQQAQFEAGTTFGDNLRASLLVEPTYLSGGTPTGTGNLLFGRQTTPANFAAQSAGGVAVESQLSTQSFGLDVGVTPQGFLTHNWTGGVRLTPGNGPVTLLFERDSVRDTMLSYSGERDPQSGQVWGGVMSNSGSVHVHHGDATSGIYASAGYQSLVGRNIARNQAETGDIGVWWKLGSYQNGDLTVGMNFSAMHYDRNLRYFTFGQGGYFSPQQYFLFNVPVRWTGAYGKRLKYSIAGSLGLQHFSEDASDYYPMDPVLQAQQNARYPSLISTGANFSFDGRLSYQMAPHWMLGAFASANNARDYTAASAGVFVKYTFDERPMDLNLLPSVPDWKGQQPVLPF